MNNDQMMIDTTAEEVTTLSRPAPVAQRQETGMMLNNIFGSVSQFEAAQRVAKLLAASDYVPENYRGNVANCTIAIDVANRMGISPLMVMQTLYIVRGKPSWSGQACKALIDGSGKFENTEYVYVGTEGSDSWGCYLQGIDKKSGKVIKGTTVTIQMAKQEGWYNKSGSKWQTMPELMLAYRAAAFFLRVHCPSMMMGFQTAEEVADVDNSKSTKATAKTEVNIDDI